MRKLELAALSYDRDALLDLLGKTEAVEIATHAETEGTVPLEEGGEELRARISALEGGISALNAAAEELKEKSDRAAALKEGFSVSRQEFMAAGELKEDVTKTLEEVTQILSAREELSREETRLLRELAAAEPYRGLDTPFSAFADTPHTKTALGVVPSATWEETKAALSAEELSDLEEQPAGEGMLVSVTAHRAVWQEVSALLAAAGFSPCQERGEDTGRQRYDGLSARLAENRAKRGELSARLAALSPKLPELKLYADYLGFQLEKEESAAKFRGTERTFFLEAFVPGRAEEKVAAALDGCGLPLYYLFSDPAEDEELPTLVRNGPVIGNFETITNMYSPPNARELDPNAVMAFFYSLFLGFIMADMGYGLLMMAGGFVLWKKMRGGVKSLAGVFGVGGIFTFLWGILFNSLFGIRILPFTVMPDAQNAMYSLAGIEIPSVLIISLLLGVVQLFAGYVCKFAQCVHHGRVWDGVFDGLTWAAFSLGVGIAVVGLVEDFRLPALVTAGGIVAGVSLAVAVVTAGRHEKRLGKLTKSFGSLYGLISYFTDVLSYIRLYGLMLTGAVIAQVISDYSLQFLSSGSVLIVLGVVLMIVGHLFNLAIGLLGAYIHTARLQYVEFFGRFYEGEGRLFTPLGSQTKYVYIDPPAEKRRKEKAA